jgi:hypothetical protein
MKVLAAGILSALAFVTIARAGTLDNIYNAESGLGSSYMSLGQPLPQGTYSTQGVQQGAPVPMQTYSPNQSGSQRTYVAPNTAVQQQPMVCANGICRLQAVAPQRAPTYTYVAPPNYQRAPTFYVAPAPQVVVRRR